MYLMEYIVIADAVTPTAEGGNVFELSIWAVMFGVLLMLVILYALYRMMSVRERKKLLEQKQALQREFQKEKEGLKHEVLAKVSQELVAPITLVVGPLQQLATEPLPNGTKERVQMVLRNAQILLHQVNKLPLGQKVEMTEAMFSTFDTVKQPVQVAAAPVEQVVEAENLDRKVVDDNNAAEVVSHPDDQEEDMKEENHRFTMLMVDDSADMCRFVRDYFRGVYNVLTASNGEQALKCLEENDGIDLVVSDVTMPKMDGLTLCKTIKSDLRWSHIPVVLLTGRTGEQMEMEGLKLGADDYITKPFNVEKLRLRVKNLIEKKEARQRQFREKIDVAPSEITITPVDEQFIQQAIKICEDHISDTEFSVEVLGRELSLSRTYLYKKLVNITGKGPAEFIRTIRMKRGKQYLEKTSMQITEIATELGYNNPKRFTENFKIEYGMSPSEYVRKFRAERVVKSPI